MQYRIRTDEEIENMKESIRHGTIVICNEGAASCAQDCSMFRKCWEKDYSQKN